MTGVPAPTLYHRWLGWHAPAMRRALTAFIAGLILAVVLLPFVTWGLALVGGWDAAALTVLLPPLALYWNFTALALVAALPALAWWKLERRRASLLAYFFSPSGTP